MFLEVTDHTPGRALGIGDFAVGDAIAQKIVFNTKRHEAFVCLARDRTRVHGDPVFALQKGFTAPIIQGLAVISHFSRLMGMYLPGEHAVLEKVEFKFHRPVYADHELLYTCKVARVLKPLRVVSLALSISHDGVDCVTGQSQCAIL